MHIFYLFILLLPFSLKGDFVETVIKCQLGNQFFQVAAGTSLALDNNATPIFPDFERKKSDNIPLNYSEVFFRVDTKKPRIPKFSQYFYEYRDLPYKPIPYKRNMVIKGFFASEKYFKHHKEHILTLFAPSEKIKSYLYQKYASIIDHPNSVSIHYRDFVPEVKHGTFRDIKDNYYTRALSYFNPDESIFVVFTNNSSKCKAIFSKLPYQFIFIEGESHYHDLYLMSMCKHNIICNSSFSWWAAYLNLNPNKIVISPLRWFYDTYATNEDDLIPPEWIRL